MAQQKAVKPGVPGLQDPQQLWPVQMDPQAWARAPESPQKERAKLTEELKTQAEHMEAEIFLRSQQLDDANGQLRAANEELSRLYEKTKELDHVKTQFFANVSHELRTPLSLIPGPLKRLLSGDLTSAVRSDLELAERNARSLLGSPTFSSAIRISSSGM